MSAPNHLRRIPALASLATLLLGLLGTGTAQAAPSLVQEHAGVGCSVPFTVKTPTDAAQSDPSRLAAALGLPGSSQVIAKAVDRHVTWLSSISCKPRPDRTRRPSTTGTPVAANGSSINWSGYIAYNASSPTYVQSEWTVPAISTADPTVGNTNSSIWPGIGGWDGVSGELLQDGTEQDATCALLLGSLCTEHTTSTYFWLEDYPAEPEQEITNLVPKAGDSVAAVTSYSSGTVSFTLCDFTANQCVQGSQAAKAPGNSAEWIVERPSVNGRISALSDFGTATLTDNVFNDANRYEQLPQDSNASAFDMFNSSGNQLDATGSLGSDGTTFSVNWERSS
ncbi:hypothetical protein OG455_09080 [Kitasatospora sp. NBC_01287]|uniref:G1 family glutamic endopeptidase n=1 Tax=Kitasatospora sp. NBC_01287 TaxID=2903573 RepID=UPI002252C48A|nr:G1 family glutamic endopeptidase [Kitasatospora sp. NBC_01287]MCX4745673.1 hypothetical protein [Kitasatospora sp. NBC_01287]